MQWHANCNYIATGSSDKTVRLWDVQSGECVRIFIGHRSMILSLAMSPDGRFMASGDEDGTIMMWDLSTGRCVTPLIGHTSCVWTLAFRCIKENFDPTPHQVPAFGFRCWRNIGCFPLQLWGLSPCLWLCRLHSEIMGRNFKHKATKNRWKVSSP